MVTAVVLGSYLCAEPVQDLVDRVKKIRMGQVYEPEPGDLIVFTGGADVSPWMYQAKPHHTTYSDPPRDKVEAMIYHAAKRQGIPMVGICRGAQFLNVMNGGTLLQDVPGHRGGHLMYTAEGETMEVTSTHHQMIRMADGAVLYGWAEEHREGGVPDPEVVYYPATKSLCVQYHPEYGSKSDDMWKYFQSKVKELLLC